MNVLQERVLELEYVKAVAPKKQDEPCPHDDWVSAVDGSRAFYLHGIIKVCNDLHTIQN